MLMKNQNFDANHDKNVNCGDEKQNKTNKQIKKKRKEMKLFPHFPGSQNFFDRLPHNFVLC